MADVEICHICLATGVKMKTESNLRIWYDLTIGCNQNKRGESTSFCYECAALLNKTYKFKNKCLRGQIAIEQMQFRITKESIHKINNIRCIYDLKSNLQQDHLVQTITIEPNLTFDRKDIDNQIEDIKCETNDPLIDCGNTFNKTEKRVDVKKEFEIEHPKICDDDNNLIKHETLTNDKVLCKSAYNNKMNAGKTKLTKKVKKIKKQKVINDDNLIKDESCNNDIVFCGQNSEKVKKQVKRIKNKNYDQRSDGDNSIKDEIFINDIDIGEQSTDDEERIKVKKKVKSIKVKNQNLVKKGKRPYGSLITETDDNIIANFLNVSNNWLITKLSEEDVVIQFNKKSELPTFTTKEFKCLFCFKGFVNKDKLVRHNAAAHNQKYRHSCKICQFRTPFAGKMRHHMLIHNYTYQCRHCDYFTTHLSSAKFHQDVHEEVTKTCKICAEVFVHSSSFYSHMRALHPSEHLCRMCGKSFASTKGVACHMKRTHSYANDARSKRRRQLAGESLDDSKYHCDTCDVTFYNDNAYKMHFIHSSKHTENLSARLTRKPYRYFKKRSRYNPDMIRLIVNREKKCNDNMGGSDLLNPYLLQDPSAPVMCEICGKSVKVSSLESHRNIHTRSRLHRCDVCLQDFVQKSSLNRHMVKHTGVKAYKCQLCDKSYTQCGSLKLHVNTAHLNLPYPKRNRWKRKQTDSMIEN